MITRHATVEALDAAPGPVNAIISLPKTGTTTLGAALVRGGLQSLIRTHTLRPGRLDRREARYQSDLHHLQLIWEAQWLASNPPTVNRPWRVVTAVRDPIARFVSATFQSFGAPGASALPDSVDVMISRLSAQFERALRSENPWAVDYFDINFATTMGISVYDHPFDPSVGWARITTDHAEVLLMRMESLDEGAGALSSLFGVDVATPLRAENVGQHKAYADLYRGVLDELRPPPAYVDLIYGQRMARHFYSATELEVFRERWMRS